MNRYLMRWPITEPRTPLDVLIGQAEHDLRAALAAEQLRPAGKATWFIRHDRKPVLAVEIDVEPLAATA